LKDPVVGLDNKLLNLDSIKDPVVGPDSEEVLAVGPDSLEGLAVSLDYVIQSYVLTLSRAVVRSKLYAKGLAIYTYTTQGPGSISYCNILKGLGMCTDTLKGIY
jgi:hypothetical protein